MNCNTHWVEATGMPYGGVYHGSSEIAANVFGPIANDVQDFTAKPDEIIRAGDDRVLALGTYRGHWGEWPSSSPLRSSLTVRDGRITNFVQHVDTHLDQRVYKAQAQTSLLRWKDELIH